MFDLHDVASLFKKLIFLSSWKDNILVARCATYQDAKRSLCMEWLTALLLFTKLNEFFFFFF